MGAWLSVITSKHVDARARMLKDVRAYFDEQDFLEVETPILMTASTFNPYIEEIRTADGAFLQTSPEHYMKRLLAGGAERIYQIAKFFRKNERGDLHNPEFTGLEFYEVGADYHAIMDRTEAIVSRVLGLTGPLGRRTVREVFLEYADVDPLDIQPSGNDSYDDAFFRIFLEHVEPHLGDTFLYDYPVSMGIMARAKPGDPQWAERVELFIGGVELANGFTELTDAAEQRARFERDRERMGRTETEPLDEAFLDAVAAMPACAGIAVGLDRLLMLKVGASSIDAVLPFR